MWKSYAISGTQDATVISQGNRYKAEHDATKEVCQNRRLVIGMHDCWKTTGKDRIITCNWGLGANRTSFSTTTIFPPTRWNRCSRDLKTAIHAQDRPKWLPCLDPPPYFDGT
ncbi:chlorophyll A-B binding protein [Artemisia annua]|uniref:Chlorophyll A-B binding protein n=1 Tax=Artemisia annua TaxID=35608 RepID=A0A2U1PJC5_ARTAN|nr:chlorophyll A-B binding protein [Artemisia annua]